MAKGKKSDTIKWIVVAVAILLLGVAVAAAITNGFKTANPYGWLDKPLKVGDKLTGFEIKAIDGFDFEKFFEEADKLIEDDADHISCDDYGNYDYYIFGDESAVRLTVTVTPTEGVYAITIFGLGEDEHGALIYVNDDFYDGSEKLMSKGMVFAAVLESDDRDTVKVGDKFTFGNVQTVVDASLWSYFATMFTPIYSTK